MTLKKVERGLEGWERKEEEALHAGVAESLSFFNVICRKGNRYTANSLLALFAVDCMHLFMHISVSAALLHTQNATSAYPGNVIHAHEEPTARSRAPGTSLFAAKTCPAP